MTQIFGKNPDKSHIKNSVNYKAGEFTNLEHTVMLTEEASYLKMTKDLFFSNKNRVPSKPIPSIKTALNNLNKDEDAITWLGHSSYHISFSGKHILVDPVFSGYASPFSFMIKAFEGSNKYQANDFDNIDVLILWPAASTAWWSRSR